MHDEPMNIVILGLSITSSWGNGHATCYRGLVRELARQGHHVLFLERDMPWFADHRDLDAMHARVELYDGLDELRDRFSDAVRRADAVIVGSYVPDGVAVGEWVTHTARGVSAFYDIDTPVTLAKLRRGDHEYLAPPLIPRYALYLSFAGGPTLAQLERSYGSPMAAPLYCAVDPERYHPEPATMRWDLGYLGTYCPDRQRPLGRFLLDAARALPGQRFIVAGPQYPDAIRWPANVEHRAHLPPVEHRAFYNAQRFTLNLTRRDMIRAGHAPSVRLFEAAACATPIISDHWPGLDALFEPGREILIARSTRDVLTYLQRVSDDERTALAQRARRRVLNAHTAAHRAAELVGHLHRARDRNARAARPPQPGASHARP